MFVLHELERLLSSQKSAESQPTSRPQHADQPNLPDIERIDVTQLELFKSVRLHEMDLNKRPSEHHMPLDLGAFMSTRSYLTVDALFASKMNALLLDRLAQIPERSFPSARLMICDQEAYGHLLKLQYVLQRIYPDRDSLRFLLHKRPYSVTAVVLISDIMDLLDRVGRPIARVHNEKAANYDYTIIKQVFPYLRTTDLVVVLGEIGALKLQTFTSNGPKSHQAIQFLTRFARSSHLIELLPIARKLGQQHFQYDNASSFRAPNYNLEWPLEKNLGALAASSKQKPIQEANPHLKLTLMQLNFIAYRLDQLVGQLEWQLDSITFRLGDPLGFSKIFSRILESIVKSEQPGGSSTSGGPSSKQNLSLVPVRVIVLDRFFDLQGLLRHSDKYGPFLEQEIKRSNIDSSLAVLRLDEPDPLDGVLQFARLTEVLKSILKHSSTTTPKLADNQKRSRASPAGGRAPPAGTQMHAIAASNSIRRHLDLVKSIYKSMSEGYLLLLMLEASLAGLLEGLQRSQKPLLEAEQNDWAERTTRISTVLKQLLSLQSHSVTLMNGVRVAMLLVDAINIFLYLHPDDTPATRKLLQVKDSLMALREFKTPARDSLNSFGILSQTAGQPPEGTTTAFGDGKQRDGRKDRDANKDGPASLAAKLEAFETISRERCSRRATASLEEIVQQFYERRLDPEAFPTVKLSSAGHGLVKSVSRNKIIVLVLGSISYDELARIKLLESTLMQKRKAGPQEGPAAASGRISSDILAISSGVVRPDEFVASL